ncbi:hypothetical protein PTTG_28048 [Puccinia triticina 1-1 BBBD Race 1]|uniref:Uncharacterized protein n=1 Tax=Puccinia triticina (isolate 1-1 / race 1 (BBBD)) TaxID=630390 RepID=A0A180GEP5_PUCT1|nr:hypothetical protein PTTG_28048 [Puccinia triticina 1-1 BBBD Race 1]
MLMQNLFGDLKALGNQKMLLVKLREIGRFEKTSKSKPAEKIPASTALATNAPNAKKRKKSYILIRCIGSHNPIATHPPEECWTLNPGLLCQKKEEAKKEKLAATYLQTTASNSA